MPGEVGVRKRFGVMAVRGVFRMARHWLSTMPVSQANFVSGAGAFLEALCIG